MPLSEVLAKINWVDVLSLFFFIRIGYKGFNRGFSSEVVPFLAVLAALMMSLHNYSYVGQFIIAFMRFPVSIANLISFTILYTAVIYACKLASAFFAKNVRMDVRSMSDRVGGMLLGMLRATFSVCFVLVFLVLVPFPYFESSIKNRSLMGEKFLMAGPALYDRIVKITSDTERYHKGTMKQKIMKTHWPKKERKKEDKDKKKGIFD